MKRLFLPALIAFALFLTFPASTVRAQPPADSLNSYCDYLRIQGVSYDGPGTYDLAYDTIRLFVERCALDRPSSGWLSIFETLGGAVSGLSSSNQSIWPDYREWLKKVLYYSSDTEYYCADVNEVYRTYAYNAMDDQSDMAAVLGYIIQSGKCPKFTTDYQQELERRLYWRHKLWADSMASWGYYTIANPYNPTLPSIDDLGLSLLRGNQSGVAASAMASGPALTSVTARNNPFHSSLDLTLHMGREALVTVELFDLLGHQVPMKGMRYFLKQAGDQRVTLPTEAMPAGTYYLRVTTDQGDVKSIQVVKEGDQ